MIIASVLLLITFIPKVNAQEEESSWGAGLDIYSSYIWRGAKFGSGPAFQPSVSFSTGGFKIGAWGSVSSSTEEGFEMDLYTNYTVGGLTIGLTDYYFGGDWTEYKAVHNLEPSLSYGISNFTLTAAYMFLPATDAQDATSAVDASPAKVNLTTGEITPAIEAVDAIKAVEAANFGSSGDLYVEAAYSFSHAKLTLGAGNGQYTRTDSDSDGKFNICNIGVGTSKEVKLTDSFSLPVSGAVILNPSTGGFFITVGISL